MGVRGERRGMVLKQVLLARQLTFQSDASPNYKHMFGPHRVHFLIYAPAHEAPKREIRNANKRQI